MLNKKKIAALKAGIVSDSGGSHLVFQALGDAGRFTIFRLLMEHKDLCVTDIANVLGITVSAASQQLRVLERLGLVSKVRMGQMVCYELNCANRTAKQLSRLFFFRRRSSPRAQRSKKNTASSRK